MALQILTGESGSGKTTWLQALIERKRAQGCEVTGVLSPAVFQDGEKVAIDVVLLSHDERFELAPRKQFGKAVDVTSARHESGWQGAADASPEAGNPGASGASPLGAETCWGFDELAFARVNEYLKTLFVGSGEPPAAQQVPLLIIDELGPLELVRSAGYTEALKLLDEERYKDAIVVIRPSLLALAQERWPHAEVIMPQAEAPAV